MHTLFFLIALLGQAPDTAFAVIPRPVHMTRGRSGPFVLTTATVIVTDRATRDIGYQLTDWLAPATGYHLPVRAAGGSAPTISLRLDPSLTPLGDEGYQLSVTARQITIRARRPAGGLYAGRALRPVLPRDGFRAPPPGGGTRPGAGARNPATPRAPWRRPPPG